MTLEPLILGGFVGLQIVFHECPRLLHHIEHAALIERMRRHSYIVWLAHPAIVHGVKDYAIHLCIYSGIVIPAH